MALGVNCHLEEKDAMHFKDGGVMSKTIVNIIITTLRKIHHEHHLEEKDAKHVHNGGGHHDPVMAARSPCPSLSMYSSSTKYSTFWFKSRFEIVTARACSTYL